MSSAGEVEPDLLPESPVERVEHMGDALKRLAQGAGKDDEDTCAIEEVIGRSWDGRVVTEIRFPFEFVAKLEATTLKNTLNHLVRPEVKATARSVILKESGKRFQLRKLSRECVVPDWGKPDETQTIHGAWLTRLLPVLPTRSGNQLFAGVLACPQGYVGSDGAILMWIDAPGPEQAGLIPRELIGRIPSGELQFRLDEARGLVWVIDNDTTWTSPLLHGTFPQWEGAFFETDRHVEVLRRDLIDALKACVSIEPHGHLLARAEDQLLTCQSVQTAAQRTVGSTSSRAQASVPIQTFEGDDFHLTLDTKRLLASVDKLTGERVRIGTDVRQDRAYVQPVDMQPMVHIMLMGIVGFGAMPADIE